MNDFVANGFRRGHYIQTSAMPSYIVTTSGLAYGGDVEIQRARIIEVGPTWLTIRDAHRWRIMEWFHARYEDIVWWFADVI